MMRRFSILNVSIGKMFIRKKYRMDQTLELQFFHYMRCLELLIFSSVSRVIWIGTKCLRNKIRIQVMCLAKILIFLYSESCPSQFIQLEGRKFEKTLLLKVLGVTVAEKLFEICRYSEMALFLLCYHFLFYRLNYLNLILILFLFISFGLIPLPF